MSTQCSHFVQNAWKKEFCSNCFKPREEHVGSVDNSRLNLGKATMSFKTDNHKLQSILKGKMSSQAKKKVAFPESLTEIIGYGGDDFSDSEEFELNESSSLEDEVPDNEEERALSNLTRTNTNFNTITANLTEVATAPEAKKSFASLMLGKVQKDADGKKKTLLVSVTPFGGDDLLPTAKRPNDKKIGNHSNLSSRKNGGEVATMGRSEVTLKSVKNTEEIIGRDRKEKSMQKKLDGPELEKIVDMPLITSSNLISVIQKSDALTANDVQVPQKVSDSCTKSLDQGDRSKIELDKRISIARTPAMKKSDGEKPKISMLQNACNGRAEYSHVTKVTKHVEFSRMDNNLTTFNSGIELTLTPFGKRADEMDETVTKRNGENEEKSMEDKARKASCGLVGREVEGEATSNLTTLKKFNFEESRELAGEPDGKADEEVTEPPALPRNNPPLIDSRSTRNSLQGEPKPLIATTEPRTSFLHGGEVKTKPAVPQKPVSFPSKASALPKSPTSSAGLSFKKTMISSFVPSSSFVQNTTLLQGQSVTRSSSIEKIQLHEDRNASTTSQNPNFPNVSTQSNGGKNQFQVVRNSQDQLPSTKTSYSVQSEDRTLKKLVDDKSRTGGSQSRTCIESNASRPAKMPASSLKPKPPPLALNRNLRNEEEDEEEEVEEDEDEDEEVEIEVSEISREVTAELIRSPNKRRMAPKPPATPTEELAGSLFARNPGGVVVKSDSPVVREKEKRERASSCNSKFRKAISEAPDPCVRVPEPSPRRTISLSQDSLANPDRLEEKKKSRSRFSLKKFLRMGSKKDVDMTTMGSSSPKIDEIPTTPQPKPRLEIIHPLELDGADVEVVSNDRIARISEDVTDSKIVSAQSTSNIHHATTRPGKPPPPPRNQSLDDWSRLDPANKPARPPPPRADIKLPPKGDKPSPKTWQPATSPSSPSDSIYANLAAEDVAGEVRSALAPSKPQRTASMRDQVMSQPPMKKRTVPAQNQSLQDYEALGSAPPPTSESPTNDSHVYECLSSSPECDSNLELRHVNGSQQSNCKRKSDSSALDPGIEFKYHHQPFTRSTSLPYCGSETESELYAPYSFYTGDEGPEEDQDWKNKDDEFRVSRLRKRRGRSIVHRSLEDNYGAVVVANHEALAQLLEQLNQASPLSLGLRCLKTASPRLSDFNLDTTSSVTVGKRIFYSAIWNEHNVTLCIAFDLALHVSRKEFYLVPIVEFRDAVPDDILEMVNSGGKKNLEATISVLPRLQVNTIQTFALMVKDTKDESVIRELSFVFVQYVSVLKNLQARGIEEAPKSLNNVVLCREDKDACYRLYLLQGLNTEAANGSEEERVSLCACALIALQELFLTTKLPLIRELLLREKAVTLSQVKSVLEFSLWGPADATLGGLREREVILQRWLDLERATVLHALVRARAPLTVTDEYHLLFLVRTSAKILCEASILLDKQRNNIVRTV